MEDITGEQGEHVQHHEVVARLQAFGRQPVDAATADRVLAGATVHRRWSWLRSARTKVAAAAAGGFLVGSVGLASAGSLPSPAQQAAHNVLGSVGISVPPGHDRYNDPTACPGGPYKNHGAYVRAHKNDPNAGASPCGKPVQSLNGQNQNGTEQETPEKPDAPDTDGNGRGGPPPWAHAKGNGKNKDGKNGAAPGSATPAPSVAPTTTTTAAPTTTTTAAPTTTTSSTSTSTSTTSTPTTAAPVAPTTTTTAAP